MVIYGEFFIGCIYLVFMIEIGLINLFFNVFFVIISEFY